MQYKLINTPNSSLGTIENELINRGLKKDDISHFLNTTDEDIVDFNLLNNMENGIKMLLSHINNNDKILIQIDSDVDGYTSAAILINFLYLFFPAFVRNNISYRVHEGKEHGIIYETVPENVKLVICPDSSSSDYEIHEQLKQKDIDVFVLDHHKAVKESEFACVINNQLCDYPTKSLSGAGIVYKFCSYFDSVANTAYADLFLDLVALGLIADMSSLRDFETSHLIKKGLNSIRNPFFKTMCENDQFHFKDGVTPFGVAFFIAPFINATVRMGTSQEKLLLFESLLDFKANEQIPSTKKGCKGQYEMRVTQACRNCTNIKKKQTDARDACLNIIERKIQDYNLLENKILFIQLAAEDNINPTIRGLIANELASKYQRPVMILSLTEETQMWEGSCRGADGLPSFRSFLLKTGLAEYCEGHDNALGCGILNQNISSFIQLTNEMLKDYDFSPCYKVDFIFDNMEFDPTIIFDIYEYKAIWGQGLEEPYVVIENIKVSKDNLILMSRDSRPTLKITLDNGVCLIKFKSSETEYENLYSDLGCVIINIVGHCTVNEWRGRFTPQIEIEDYEIVQRQDYYF